MSLAAEQDRTQAPRSERGLRAVAIAAAIGALGLAGLAWLTNADAIFAELAAAALAMCM